MHRISCMIRFISILYTVVTFVASFSGQFCGVRKQKPLNFCSDNSGASNDKTNEKVEYANQSLERLFLKVEEVGIDKIPDELRNSINKKIVDNGPSEIEMKMNIMGITPLTVTGFTIGFIIIILNNVLGNGWATYLFYGDKVEDQVTATSDSIYSQFPVSKEVIDRIILNHDEYLKEKVNYH